jgi:hypothetical protein
MKCVFRCVSVAGRHECVCQQCGRLATVLRLPVHAECQPRRPSIARRAANFAAAAAQHVAAGMPMCDQTEIDRRFAICQQCEHFDGTACSQCGCPVVRERNWRSKLSWAEQACPVGKWGPVAT